MLAPGQVLARLTWLGTFVETQHDDFEDVEGRGPMAIVHDQSLVITEARLALDIGLTRRFGLTLMVPLRVIDTSIRYLDMAGTEVQLVTPGIHHRNETRHRPRGSDRAALVHARAHGLAAHRARRRDAFRSVAPRTIHSPSATWASRTSTSRWAPAR